MYMLPMAAMILLVSPVSGRLVGARGARPFLMLAGVAVTIGALMLTRLTAYTSRLYLLGAYFVYGIGAGMVNPPISNDLMGRADRVATADCFREPRRARPSEPGLARA